MCIYIYIYTCIHIHVYTYISYIYIYTCSWPSRDGAEPAAHPGDVLRGADPGWVHQKEAVEGADWGAPWLEIRPFPAKALPNP